MPLKPTHGQSGFAMLEALITAIIVAIGVSGVGVLLLRSVQATQDSSQKSQAMWIVQDFAGRLRANGTAARDGQYEGVISSDSCEIAYAGPQCASHSVNKEAAICSPEELATFDKYITVCDLGVDDSGEDELATELEDRKADEINMNYEREYNSPVDFMANPTLTSECTMTTTKCVQYNIVLSWDTKQAKGSATELERNNTNSYSLIVEFN